MCKTNAIVLREKGRRGQERGDSAQTLARGEEDEKSKKHGSSSIIIDYPIIYFLENFLVSLKYAISLKICISSKRESKVHFKDCVSNDCKDRNTEFKVLNNSNFSESKAFIPLHTCVRILISTRVVKKRGRSEERCTNKLQPPKAPLSQWWAVSSHLHFQ